jgi:hypothetical protein
MADSGQIHNNLNTKYNNYLNNMKQYAQGGQLTRFDEGGTHEQNPLGGIPQGQDGQGNMNTVEQGESKKGNFVYSNRIALDKNLIKQFNLPGYITNKSVSDASKAIDDKFKDRQDKYAQETKKTLLDRLAQAQEHLKAQEQAQQQQINQSMQANSQQVPDMMEGQIPEGMEEFTEPQQNPQEEMMEGQQQMYLGGDINKTSNIYSNQKYMFGGKINRYDYGGPFEDENPYFIKSKEQLVKSQGQTDTVNAESGLMSKESTANTTNKESGFNASKFTQLGTGIGNSIYNQDQNKNTQIGAINTAGASIGGDAGKYTQAATGIYDMGQEAFGKSNVDTSGKQSVHGASAGKSAGSGALKGASTGAALGSVVPGVGTVIGAGVGAIVGGVTGFIGGKKDETAQALNNQRYSRNINNQFQDPQNQAAYGGTLNPGVKYSVGNSTIRPSVEIKNNTVAMMANGGELTKDMFDNGSNLYTNRYAVGGQLPVKPKYYDDYVKASNYNPNNEGTISDQGITSKLANDYLKVEPTATLPTSEMLNPTTNTTSSTSKNKESWLDRNSGKFGEAARYAPIAMNAYQLSQLKSPQGVQYNTSDVKYKPQYVDEAQLQNIAAQNQRNQINAVSESGGSEGANRAAILGAGVNMNRGLSEAYLNMKDRNMSMSDRAQQFDSAINSQNIAIKNRAIDEMRADKGNYDTQKSKFLSAIGTDVGSVGKEEVNKTQIAAMLGYDWRGNYMVDPETGERITAERMAKDKAALEASNEKPVYNSKTGEKITYNSYGGFLKTNKRGY